MSPLKKCMEKSEGNLYEVIGAERVNNAFKLKVQECQEEPRSDNCTPVN